MRERNRKNERERGRCLFVSLLVDDDMIKTVIRPRRWFGWKLVGLSLGFLDAWPFFRFALDYALADPFALPFCVW